MWNMERSIDKNPTFPWRFSPWEGFLLLNMNVSKPVLWTPHTLQDTSHSASMLTTHSFMYTVSVVLLSLCAFGESLYSPWFLLTSLQPEKGPVIHYFQVSWTIPRKAAEHQFTHRPRFCRAGPVWRGLNDEFCGLIWPFWPQNLKQITTTPPIYVSKMQMLNEKNKIPPHTNIPRFYT